MSSHDTPSSAVPIAPSAPFELDQTTAERLTGGTWIGAQHQVITCGATQDSRAVRPGMLFVCCAGTSHDGHDFAAQAVQAGATMVLASRLVNVTVPVLLVEDVVHALAKLATEFRARHRGATWIGITGSNGKTTTKELIAAACGAPSPTVHYTRGNLNNHLGVPLTVLSTPAGITHAVIEMGANHQGEIATLAAIVHPDVGVITSIGPAHLEGFGGLLGVARGKSELFAALPHDSEAICGIQGLAAVCEHFAIEPQAILDILRERAIDRRLMLVGSPNHPVEGEVLADGIELRTAHGAVRLALLGQHNLANATVAFHAARAAGMPPAQILAGFSRMAPVTGRLATISIGAHRIIDDSYNANPASMVAGLTVLAKQPGQRLAVLGSMGELGTASEQGHAQVGNEAARLALPIVVVGERAAAIANAYRSAGGTDLTVVPDHAGAIAAVRERLADAPTTVLVKASRSAGLDAVVRGLTETKTGALP